MKERETETEREREMGGGEREILVWVKEATALVQRCTDIRVYK
jgi:hypothetical protein